MQKDLPERLKKYRKETGYSQSKVASLIKVSLRTYQNYENGETSPNNMQVYNNIMQLLSGTVNKEKEEADKEAPTDQKDPVYLDRIADLEATITDLRKDKERLEKDKDDLRAARDKWEAEASKWESKYSSLYALLSAETKKRDPEKSSEASKMPAQPTKEVARE